MGYYPLSSHEHTLSHHYVENGSSKEQCDVCDKEIYGLVYACEVCNFIRHGSCAQKWMPSLITHASHSMHYLHCLQLQNKSSDFFCERCCSNSRGPRYQCWSCKIDVDLACVSSTTDQPTQGDQGLMPARWVMRNRTRHFSHGKPLALFKYRKTSQQFELDCSWCDKRLSGMSYGCFKGGHYGCKFFLHESCMSKIPKRLLHPCHLLHYLYVQYSEHDCRFSCNACKRSVSTLSWTTYYACHKCRFYLHISCARLQPTFKHKCHEHCLTYFSRSTERCFNCGACGHDCNAKTNKEGGFYRCVQCDFNIHLRCLPAPPMSKHRYHLHFLVLHPGVIEDDSGEYYCDICEEERNPKHHIYYCKKCKFIAHVECVLKEVSDSEARKMMDLVEGVQQSNEEFPKLKKTGDRNQLFAMEEINFLLKDLEHEKKEKVKYFEEDEDTKSRTSSDDDEDEKSDHDSDEEADSHRDSNAKNIKEGGFYRCVQCNLNIHSRCLPAPPIAKHRYHRHFLILHHEVIEDDSGEYCCEICEKERNPKHHVYYCKKCNFIAHVECVLKEASDSEVMKMMDLVKRIEQRNGEYPKLKETDGSNIEIKKLFEDNQEETSLEKEFENKEGKRKEVDEEKEGEDEETVEEEESSDEREKENKNEEKEEKDKANQGEATTSITSTKELSCHPLKPLKKATLEIHHFSHNHPLNICQLTQKYKYFNCNACGKELCGIVYICKTCEFPFHYGLHKCIELPSERQHPIHSQHSLILVAKFPYSKTAWFLCDKCTDFSAGFVYLCMDCPFKLDVKCAVFDAPEIGSQHPKPREKETNLIHFSHKHMLVLGNLVHNLVLCLGCDLPILGPAYCCLECFYTIHESCLELLPKKMHHPFHPLHSLVAFSEYSEHKCHACKLDFYLGLPEERNFIRYGCLQCKLALHFVCANSLRRVLKSNSHMHNLYYCGPDSQMFFEQFSRYGFNFKCSTCSGMCKEPFYRCVECAINFHLKCVPIPEKIKSKYHLHHLTLKDSFIEDDTGEYYCDVCEEERNPKDHIYYCEECHGFFIAHIECVLSMMQEIQFLLKVHEQEKREKMDSDDDDGDKKVKYLERKIDGEKEKEDEETMKEESSGEGEKENENKEKEGKIESNQGEASTSINGTKELSHHPSKPLRKPALKIHHFSHNHPLNILQTQKYEHVNCNACGKELCGTVDTYKTFEFPFNYGLHKACTELPYELQHPLHSYHSLTLLSKFPHSKWFLCDECRDFSAGFVYLCKDCPFEHN